MPPTRKLPPRSSLMPTSKEMDVLGHYLRDIGRYTVPTPQEEIELGKKVRLWRDALARKEELEESGIRCSDWEWQQILGLPEPWSQVERTGMAARKEMVQRNMRLVVNVAKKYKNRGADLSDLISEGAIGLQRGTEKFDPAKGYRFSTYAYWWIKQSITRAVPNLSRVIRIPVHIVESINELRKHIRAFQSQHHRQPTLTELAELKGSSVDYIRDLLSWSFYPMSIESRSQTHINQDPWDSTDYLQFLVDNSQDSWENVETKEIEYTAEQLLEALSNPSHKEVVRMRFGIGYEKSYKLGEIGAQLGISKERVRQIELLCLQKMRSQIAQKKVRCDRGVLAR